MEVPLPRSVHVQFHRAKLLTGFSTLFRPSTSGFRVVKHERTANLFNASDGSIVVSEVVDLEVHFGDVFLRLEEILVAKMGFNVISP